MTDFYSKQDTRVRYQVMLDAETSAQPVTEGALLKAIVDRQPRSLLEVGCGSGRLYRRLVAEGFAASYTGLELSPELIARNTREHPEAEWVCGSVYTAKLPAASFDIVFAYFVLEHCVYPANALARITSLLRSDGAAILVFPDFVEMGRFGSQSLGRVDARARDSLKRGNLLNVFVTLYDSRVRLPRALRRAISEFGPFPVNLEPRCLSNPEYIEPDVDAVYISSKREIAEWGASIGLAVQFPAGVDGNFRDNTLIMLQRRHKAAGLPCADYL